MKKNNRHYKSRYYQWLDNALLYVRRIDISKIDDQTKKNLYEIENSISYFLEEDAERREKRKRRKRIINIYLQSEDQVIIKNENLPAR